MTSTQSTPTYRLLYGPVMLGLRLLLHFLAPRWRVSGRRHIPHSGAFILAPNHISDVDPPVLGASVLRPLWYMAKRELFEIKGLGKWIGFCQSFSVDPGGTDRAALRRAEELLKAGQPVVIFPEGRCSPNGELDELSSGVALIALRADVPVIPVGLHATNRIMPYGSLIPRPTLAAVRVHFGAPLLMDDLKDKPSREAREIFIERLTQRLQEAIAVARAEQI